MRQFVQKLKEKPEKIKVLTVGNSVAYNFDFATTTKFLETMREFTEHTVWEFEHGLIHGGYEPEHVYHATQANANFLDGVNVVIIQYEKFSAKAKAEPLLRSLLNLPTKPFIILLQHCALDAFAPPQEAAASGFAISELSEAELRRTWQIANHYGIPVVSACNALETVKASTCKDEPTFSSIDDLKHQVYIDLMHYNTDVAGMEGCLMADMIVSAYADPEYVTDFDSDLDTLPEPFEPLSDNNLETVFFWSTMFGNLMWETSSGWELKQGGKRGNKKWLAPAHVGASLSFTSPPCSRISIEYYKHHELPMGLIEVTVDGKATTVDACCQTSCVGIPGQGFYHRAVVGDELPVEAHKVEIRLLERSSTNCTEIGNQFSLTGVYGELKDSMIDKLGRVQNKAIEHL